MNASTVLFAAAPYAKAARRAYSRALVPGYAEGGEIDIAGDMAMEAVYSNPLYAGLTREQIDMILRGEATIETFRPPPPPPAPPALDPAAEMARMEFEQMFAPPAPAVTPPLDTPAAPESGPLPYMPEGTPYAAPPAPLPVAPPETSPYLENLRMLDTQGIIDQQALQNPLDAGDERDWLAKLEMQQFFAGQQPGAGQWDIDRQAPVGSLRALGLETGAIDGQGYLEGLGKLASGISSFNLANLGSLALTGDPLQETLPGLLQPVLGRTGAAALTTGLEVATDPMTIAGIGLGGPGVAANLLGRGTMRLPAYLGAAAGAGAGSTLGQEYLGGPAGALVGGLLGAAGGGLAAAGGPAAANAAARAIREGTDAYVARALQAAPAMQTAANVPFSPFTASRRTAADAMEPRTLARSPGRRTPEEAAERAAQRTAQLERHGAWPEMVERANLESAAALDIDMGLARNPFEAPSPRAGAASLPPAGEGVMTRPVALPSGAPSELESQLEASIAALKAGAKPAIDTSSADGLRVSLNSLSNQQLRAAAEEAGVTPLLTAKTRAIQRAPTIEAIVTKTFNLPTGAQARRDAYKAGAFDLQPAVAPVTGLPPAESVGQLKAQLAGITEQGLRRAGRPTPAGLPGYLPPRPPRPPGGGVPPAGGPPPAASSGGDWLHNLVQDLPMRIGNELRQATAGLDLSNALRQGWATVRHGPSYVSDLRAMGRALVDEDFAMRTNALYKQGPGAKAGLFIADLPGEKGATNLLRREENYAGSFVGSLPGFKQTGRGNTLFLNGRRHNVYDIVDGAWSRAEQIAAPGPLQRVSRSLARPGDREALANYINRTTGRGTLGPLEGTWVSDILGIGLFSPRFQASRFQGPLQMLNLAHPRVAIEAVKDYGAAFSATVALLALANESGLAQVSLDPRSSDFGKVKIGNRRIDPWAGYQQLATLTARMLSGEMEGGYKADHFDLMTRWLRYKLSPLAGRTVDITGAWPGATAGENAIGQPMAARDWAASFLPIFAQGLYEGAKDGLLGEALTTLPASFFGLGTNVYPPSATGELNAALQDIPPELRTDLDGKVQDDWWHLSTAQQNTITAKYPEVAALAQKRQDESATEAGAVGREQVAAREAAFAAFAKTGNGAEYRAAMSDAGNEARIRYDQIYKGKDPADYTPDQKLMSAYYKNVMDAAGKDYELRDRLEAQFRARLSPQALAVLDENLQTSSDPNYQKLKAARAYLETSYWQKRDQAYQQMVATAPPGTLRAQYQTYDALSKAAADRSNPDSERVERLKSQIDSDLSRTTLGLRHADAKTDALLYIYGYTDSVLSLEARQLVAAWAAQNGISLASAPMMSSR